MRLAGLLSLCVALAAIPSVQNANAQDTNFPTGPQYLVTTGSTQFLRPIATPSLSLDTAPAYSPAAGEGQTVTEPQPVPSQFAPLPQADLSRVLWGDDWVRYVTGQNPASSAVENEIELTSPQKTPPLPSSFVESGVTRITDARLLEASGYGLTLGEVSAYWKAKRHTPRVYTNADIARLHRS